MSIDLRIDIDSIDKTSSVQFLSLSINDNINQQRDTCKFRVKKISTGFSPDVNSEVEIYDGATKIFGGIITKINIKTEVADLLIYEVTAVDYSILLDRRLILERYRNTLVSTIISGLLTKYDTEGFTMNNVVGNFQLGSMTFNRITFSEALQKMAESIGYSWYVDYNKDIHFFPKNEEPAPFNLTDTSENYIWNSLDVSNSIEQLRNAVFVEGGEEIGLPRTEEFTVSGANDEERAYVRLAHKFANTPDVEINGVAQTVGTEFLNDDADFDCMWSFQEKYIRFTEGNIPDIDDDVEVSGDPLFPVIVRVQSPVSINQYGLYEFVIRDTSIRSRDEAKERALAELRAYQNGVVESSFSTYEKGLRSGQVININSAIRGVNESFLIQRVSFSMRTQDSGVWNVELATLRTLGIINFLQFLLKDKGVREGESETLLTFLNFDDSVGVTDNFEILDSSSPPYMWMPTDPADDQSIIDANPTKTPARWNYSTWE